MKRQDGALARQVRAPSSPSLPVTTWLPVWRAYRAGETDRACLSRSVAGGGLHSPPSVRLSGAGITTGWSGEGGALTSLAALRLRERLREAWWPPVQSTSRRRR